MTGHWYIGTRRDRGSSLGWLTASLLALFALMFTLLPGAARADVGGAASLAPGIDPSRHLGPGMFLVASRSLRDPNFARTVVLLLQYDGNGALGLIINRPTGLPLARVVGDANGLGEHAHPVYSGGPVALDRVVLLVRSDTAPADSKPVFEDVHVSSSLDTLRQLTTRPAGREQFQAYVGYSGWGPGQLDGEIARGDWLLVPGDSAMVFTSDTDDVWPELIRRGDGRWVLAPGARVRVSLAGISGG